MVIVFPDATVGGVLILVAVNTKTVPGVTVA